MKLNEKVIETQQVETIIDNHITVTPSHFSMSYYHTLVIWPHLKQTTIEL